MEAVDEITVRLAASLGLAEAQKPADLQPPHGEGLCRSQTYLLIRDLCDLDSLPWVIIGDFNEILINGEKLSGPTCPERQMKGFREALGYAELIDLGFQGSKMTWWNYETQLRLDRAVATNSWSDIFGFARTEFEGVPMYTLTRKIVCTRQALESWQQNTFRMRQQQMFEVRSRLEFLMGEPVTESFTTEKKVLMTSLQSLLAQEEAFWKQRAKITWLQEGDRNSGFSHRKAANRKRKNSLLGLFNANGVWQEDDDGLERPSVTSEMNQKLCAPYSEEEVKIALFQMYPTKSPGPDGMPPLFFQHYWDSIGRDVIVAVQSFLHTGSLLKQINFTHICLIPKVKQPETMSDLRPIALCRLITDNTLVANEVAHYVHNKRERQDGYMALKLDLSKAYDRMEWAFLRKVLCVCSVRYSFLVRGKPRGYVIPSRGLRQGDPLSPYLFLLGAKGFSALLQQKQRLGLLPGIAICQGAPYVNHLLFANDSMLYAQASPAACFQIQNVIEVYGRASGQVVNFHKSSVVFSKNVGGSVQDSVANLLGVEIVESHERYLGLPTYVGRKKTATFEYIKERLAEKMKHWQGKLLSGAGKDILIRVVPTYAMSVFQLTKNFCKDLEQMCARSLSEFNLSMLAKQAWRVVSNPTSLVARLYKARYYPEGNFWTATTHASPSYSWRSIFATRDFIQTSSFWQISDGHMNEDKVRSIFIPEDAETIHSIPLSTRQHEDRLTWQLEKRASLLSPVVVVNQRVWKKIWYAKMPSSAKFLFFLWGIWKERNVRVWEKKDTAASVVALLSSTRLSSYQFHNSKLKRGIPTGRVLRWQPPPIGWLKLNFDGAYHGDDGRAAIGFLVRDSNGTFIQAVGKPVAHVRSAEHVELVVNNSSLLGRIYDDLNEDLELIPCMRIMHVRREANSATHLLAAHAIANGQDFFFSSVPSFIQNVIAADQPVLRAIAQ
ncbi:uncharacterized protein LOC133724753 [Rosa rugosa]|uniref:uncharacterized protein LOC133724753 n=1 Tax=Rosa rugosa TaxID=74645 RepID=UPI002B416319|nr:uncharacterized protein LOC133724753 [Rosa rugosa]